mgnify:CR=1 FL=1
MELKDYREKMDAIDDQLLPLFLQRMEVAAEIAAWKKANGIPVLDAGRERAKLRELEEKTPEALRDYTDSLYQTIFELSRSSQTRLPGVTSPLTEAIEKALADTPQLFPESASVACQGVEGAYSQLACDRLFRRPNVFYFASFEAVFTAIEKGLCRFGVIPLENSTAGSVKQIYDLMLRHSSFKIVRSTRLKVDHNLVAKKGTKLEDIKEIFSHPQTDIGRRLVYPEGAHIDQFPAANVVRIAFNGGSSYEPLIASLAIDCGVKVNILGADTRNVSGKAFGSMLLGLPQDPAEAARALSYLRAQKDVTVEEVRDYHA